MSKVVLFFPIIELRNKNLLPLSILLVAAPLIKKGYSVKIIDQRIEPDWRKKLLNELEKSPLLVGISVLTGKQILYGLEVSKLVKQNSKAKVVWGGVHPSLSPEQTLENQFIDIVVVGEGEETLLELVEKLDRKEKYSNVLGIGYKKNDEIVINPSHDFISLDNQPDLPYCLLDVEKYISKESFASGKPGRDLAMYTSRGCPHRCAFCYNKEFNKRRWRCLSAEKTVAEIKKIVNDYQLTSISLQDDEFFVSLERVKEICKLLLKENINVEFISSCRIDYIYCMDDEILELIGKCGFKTLELGIETGSPRMLKKVKKDIIVEQVLEAVAKLKKFDIEGKYCFMSGFPGETIEDMYQTTDLMRKVKKINPYSRIPGWRIFTPFPGIELYQESINRGWIPPKNLREWAYYDFHTIKMPWINKRIERIIWGVLFLVPFLRLQDKPLSFIHKIWGYWVDFRWKNHFFSFVPEKYFINLISKKGRKKYV